MRKNFVQPEMKGNVLPALRAALWVVAVGVPAFVMYSNGVDAARREGERRVLAEVAETINSPALDSGQVLAMLAQRQQEVRDARYVRTCNRLGIKMDWSSLFAQILQQPPQERERAARIIAEECGLDPNTNLKREQMYLMLGKLPVSVQDTLPAIATTRPSVN